MGQGSGRPHRLTDAERLELQLRVRAGETHEVAATALGCSAKSVQRLLVKTGGVKPRSTPQSALRLSLPEREEISRGLLAGDSCRVIARRLGRAPSTVSRDVARAGHRERYRAWRADETVHRRAHRPKIAKLIAAPRLRGAVERGLRRRWSPQQITARLVLDYPDDLERRVSHETIYQSLFVQGRGALRQELTRCLRRGRAASPTRSRHWLWPAATHGAYQRTTSRSRGPSRDRPLGRRPDPREAVAVGDGTLIERQTRFVMLVNVSAGRLAEHVKDALADTIRALPDHLRRSLTWDRGKEDARPRPLHARHRRAGLLLRSAQPVATRDEREQRTPAPILPQRHGPVRVQSSTPRRDRRRVERTPSTNARLAHTIRGVCARCCDDRVRPPPLL